MFGSVEKAGEEQKNHMKKQYAVLGLGRFGYAVAVTTRQKTLSAFLTIMYQKV